jgi:hypothetical protein
MLKAVKRTPHVITTKVGMAKTSSDPEVDELKRQFVTVEEESAKLQKDAKAYREAVLSKENFQPHAIHAPCPSYSLLTTYVDVHVFLFFFCT